MLSSSPSRRVRPALLSSSLRRCGRRLFVPLATAGMMLAAAAAAALDPATGKIVLTVTGKIAARNTPDAAAFDIALLEQLPRQSFTTKTPWYPKPRKFTGVLLRDVLKAAGAAPGKINATALNDYRVEIPADDIASGDAMLAYLLDDQPMTVREKGPLVIIYPFDDKPELRTAVHFSRAIWQLRSLEVQ